MEAENYPKYYRNAGKCIKITLEAGQPVGRSIELKPQVGVPLRSFIPPTRLAEEIAGMAACEQEVFKNFLFTFYQQVKEEREGIPI